MLESKEWGHVGNESKDPRPTDADYLYKNVPAQDDDCNGAAIAFAAIGFSGFIVGFIVCGLLMKFVF
jgi:hypothetical protein